LIEQAVAAEEAGFDVVLGTDHLHSWWNDSSAVGFVWSWPARLSTRAGCDSDCVGLDALTDPPAHLTLAANAVAWAEYHGLAVTALPRAGRDVDDAVLAYIWPTHHENSGLRYGQRCVASSAASTL
jgi:hypothetical protein